MEQEWHILHKHRDEIVTFIFGCLMYCIVYFGYIDRTSLRFDEVWVSNYDTIFLATGRWAGYLFRAFLGHGPAYPIAGMMAGLLLNAAVLLQLRLLGMQRLWQMLAFTTLYICSLGWCDNLQYSTMSDFFAAAVILTTVAVYLIDRGGVKNAVVATLALAVSFGCFQSAALCFLALMMLIVLRDLLAGKKQQVQHVAVRAFIVCTIAFCIFYGCSSFAFQCAPPDIQLTAKGYQASLIGWRKVYHMAGTEAFVYIWQYVFEAPLACMFGLSQHLGQWLYATVWIPSLLLVLRIGRSFGVTKAVLSVVFIICLIYMPFLFSAVLLHAKGARPYMCMAQPMVLCGLWSLGVFTQTSLCRKYKRLFVVCLLAVFVKNAYAANIAARDNRYFFDLALQEIRDMYLMARLEADKESLQSGSYLVCGKPVYTTEPRKMGGELYHTTAMPDVFANRFFVDEYAAFFRLLNMRAATNEEEAAHVQILQEMPIWPATGSVRADGDAVLIKIGEPYYCISADEK